jgi:hypothetical protein
MIARRLWTIVLLAVLLLPLTVYTIPTYIDGIEAYPAGDGPDRESIGPLSGESVVFVETVPSSELQEGDVITYQASPVVNGADLESYGITDINEGENSPVFRTSKNTGPEEDDWIAGSRVAGKEIVTVPYLGQVLRYVETRQGFLLLVVIPVLLLLLNEFRGIREHVGEEDREGTD